MVLKRVIPVLLLDQGNLVKTTRFTQPAYIGDPMNAARLFNDKEADELILLDITARQNNQAPDFALIEQMATQCFMPLCYGGGIRHMDDVKTLFSLGIEKLAFGAMGFENPHLLRDTANHYGAQSVVGVIDIKRHWLTRAPRVAIHRGTQTIPFTPLAYARHLIAHGVGELLVQDGDRDGTYQGYNTKVIASITNQVRVPVIGLGGAGSYDDLKHVLTTGHASAAAAGSIFIYQGVHRAVLISYPDEQELSIIRS
jgi:cyclase